MPLTRHPRRAQWAKRREQILDAAVKLFCEKGYEGTTIRDIARKVGVTEGLLYYYFDGKDALISACWSERNWQPHLDQWIDASADRPLSEALLHIIRRHLETLFAAGRQVRMHAAEVLRDGELSSISRERIEQTRTLLSDFFRRRQELGHIRGDVDVEMLASIILGAGFSFFMTEGRLPRSRWDERAERFAAALRNTVLQGALPCPATPATEE